MSTSLSKRRISGATTIYVEDLAHCMVRSRSSFHGGATADMAVGADVALVVVADSCCHLSPLSLSNEYPKRQHSNLNSCFFFFIQPLRFQIAINVSQII